MDVTTAEDYATLMCNMVTAQSVSLSARWLARLREIVDVGLNDVFPSSSLLDHIPALVSEIARSLCAPANNEIAANAAVMDKARELGRLRHSQHASVHQLLHEYEILGEILEAFVIDETARLHLRPSPEDCFTVVRRMTHAVRVLMRTTVDTFVSEYTTTIQEQNERLTAFNRAASHELRSPIGTLLFAGTVLNHEAVRRDPVRVARVGATVRANAERLAWLVDNLQRISRMREAVDVPSEQSVDLTALATEVARQLAEMAAARNVAVVVDPDLPSLVTDPARVELILLNLISNAIKYSDPAKPEPSVQISASGGGRVAGECTICVRDNGLGISEADQAAVFNRFFRAHAHLDQELGITGSGLGLAIVADCVHALGGSIRFESASGEGTAFFLTLPATPESAPVN
jgi:signal transduction histidine kinase